jgi:hypothetical protein
LRGENGLVWLPKHRPGEGDPSAVHQHVLDYIFCAYSHQHSSGERLCARESAKEGSEREKKREIERGRGREREREREREKERECVCRCVCVTVVGGGWWVVVVWCGVGGVKWVFGSDRRSDTLG